VSPELRRRDQAKAYEEEDDEDGSAKGRPLELDGAEREARSSA
jgi:hypothetical protein